MSSGTIDTSSQGRLDVLSEAQRQQTIHWLTMRQVHGFQGLIGN